MWNSISCSAVNLYHCIKLSSEDFVIVLSTEGVSGRAIVCGLGWICTAWNICPHVFKCLGLLLRLRQGVRCGHPEFVYRFSFHWHIYIFISLAFLKTYNNFCRNFLLINSINVNNSLAFFVIYIQAGDSPWVGRKKRNKDEKPIVKETEMKDTATAQLHPSMEHLMNVQMYGMRVE